MPGPCRLREILGARNIGAGYWWIVVTPHFPNFKNGENFADHEKKNLTYKLCFPNFSRHWKRTFTARSYMTAVEQGGKAPCSVSFETRTHWRGRGIKCCEIGNKLSDIIKKPELVRGVSVGYLQARWIWVCYETTPVMYSNLSNKDYYAKLTLHIFRAFWSSKRERNKIKKSTPILKVVISDVIPNARSRCLYDVKFFSLRCASRNWFCRVAFIILSIILKGIISFFSQLGMRLKKESKRVLKFSGFNALNWLFPG